MPSQKTGLESVFEALPAALAGKSRLILMVAGQAGSRCGYDCGFVIASCLWAP